MGRILAIDYGRKRTGLAVTDPLQIIAGTLATVATAELMEFLRKYTAEHPVERIVIGLPRQMNNEFSESYKYIEPFSRRLKREFPDIPVEFWDERFTSVLAHRAMIDGGMKKKDRMDKGVVDRISASIILQSYMESRK